MASSNPPLISMQTTPNESLIHKLGTHVKFNPSASVTFNPDETKQMADLTVENESGNTIVFKMKSTRPDLFKMRPVFGTLNHGEKKSIQLLYNGQIGSTKPSTKDHFSIVYTHLPMGQTDEGDVARLWKDPKMGAYLAQYGVSKKAIRCKYMGINDAEVDVDVKPTFLKHGEVDSVLKGCLKEEKEEKGPLMYIIYNKREEIEVSDSENEEE